MKRFSLKEPGSAITHGIGMLMALFAGIPLFIITLRECNVLDLTAILIFWFSMVLLYSASTIYHAVNLTEKGNCLLKKWDHLMIFVLIAGTYTPICLIALRGIVGIVLLSVIWALALIGIVIKLFWIYCPKWFSSVLYISMGWTCLFAFPWILKSLSLSAFLWLLIGGIIYTIGGIIYASKFSAFDKRHRYFGSHEIFHLFVMGGSICHFIVIYLIVLS